MISAVMDRHRDGEESIRVRLGSELAKTAAAILKARKITMTRYLGACLTLLARDPDRAIDNLRGHWPPEKPRGRPKKNDQESQQS